VKIFFLSAFLVALLVAGCEYAAAQDACPATVPSNGACLTWTNATLNTDGSPIPATGDGSLATTEIRGGTCTATGAPSSSSILLDVPASMSSAYFATRPLGWQCFSVRHVTAGGVFGAWSSWARKELTAPPDAKPRGPAVTVR
jgi:hypothetical protein